MFILCKIEITNRVVLFITAPRAAPGAHRGPIGPAGAGVGTSWQDVWQEKRRVGHQNTDGGDRWEEKDRDKKKWRLQWCQTQQEIYMCVYIYILSLQRLSFKLTFPLNLTGWWLKHKQETFDEPSSPSWLVGWLLRGAGASRLQYDLAQTLTQTLPALRFIFHKLGGSLLKQIKVSLPGRGKYFHMFKELSFNAELKQRITFCFLRLPLWEQQNTTAYFQSGPL